MAPKLLALSNLRRLRKLRCFSVTRGPCPCVLESFGLLGVTYNTQRPSYSTEFRRFFCFQGPAAIDYSSLLQESEFHRRADSTIHDLQEKFEEYGDTVQVDGFDIDYGNEVLTLKFGDMGTYVLNKQTPNRQIWLSSPVSGPSRFDWDADAETWVYRRTKAKLFKVLETEVEQLCGEPISLT